MLPILLISLNPEKSIKSLNCSRNVLTKEQVYKWQSKLGIHSKEPSLQLHVHVCSTLHGWLYVSHIGKVKFGNSPTIITSADGKLWVKFTWPEHIASMFVFICIFLFHMNVGVATCCQVLHDGSLSRWYLILPSSMPLTFFELYSESLDSRKLWSRMLLEHWWLQWRGSQQPTGQWVMHVPIRWQECVLLIKYSWINI